MELMYTPSTLGFVFIVDSSDSGKAVRFGEREQRYFCRFAIIRLCN